MSPVQYGTITACQSMTGLSERGANTPLLYGTNGCSMLASLNRQEAPLKHAPPPSKNTISAFVVP
jgi:hypothetical protein